MGYNPTLKYHPAETSAAMSKASPQHAATSSTPPKTGGLLRLVQDDTSRAFFRQALSIQPPPDTDFLPNFHPASVGYVPMALMLRPAIVDAARTRRFCTNNSTQKNKKL